MLAERLSKAWRARQGEVPLDAVMRFNGDGLMLGARTVLAPVTKSGPDRTIRLEGSEARLVTLLCAAHLRPVTPEALGHIRKAAERWSEGDSDIAEVHLALSGVAKLAEPGLAAQRLFLAAGLLEAGIESEAILRALGLEPSVLEALIKDYHTQPRVPSGSGRTSGQWTSDGGTPQKSPGANPTIATAGAAAAGRAALASSVGRFSLLTNAELVALAVAIAPAVVGGVALNLILVPNKSLRNEGVIPGHPPIHYLWHSDERSLVLSSTGADGVHHTAIGELGINGDFRDDRGRVIGRLLPNGTVLVLLAALVAVKTADKSEPEECPEPGKDKPGRNVAIDRDFEDYVKEFVNPGNPTPRGYGYQLPNPQKGGKLVFLDDCQHHSGDLQEDKRGYDEIITNPAKKFLRDKIDEQWLDQSMSQLQASRGRDLIWNFSNQIAADHARNLFIENDQGRENIEIRVFPWVPGQTWY